MSNRTERRAAERAALKAARTAAHNPVNPTVITQPVAAQSPEPITHDDDNFAPTPEPKTQPTFAFGVSLELFEQLNSKNNPRNLGLLNRISLLEDEVREEYNAVIQQVYNEYQPQNGTEYRLANSIVQHYWFFQRAIRLQTNLVLRGNSDPKLLALYTRYQEVNERSYYRAMKELERYQKEKRKEQIGFESQNRQQEAHEARVRHTHAKAANLEVDVACRKVMEAPLPDNFPIGFEQLAHACSIAIAAVVAEERMKREEQGEQTNVEAAEQAAA